MSQATLEDGYDERPARRYRRRYPDTKEVTPQWLLDIRAYWAELAGQYESRHEAEESGAGYGHGQQD